METFTDNSFIPPPPLLFVFGFLHKYIICAHVASLHETFVVEWLFLPFFTSPRKTGAVKRRAFAMKKPMKKSRLTGEQIGFAVVYPTSG